MLNFIRDYSSMTYLCSINKSKLNSHSYHTIVHLAASSILNIETSSMNERFIGWSKFVFSC
jgi:hypothetical protein